VRELIERGRKERVGRGCEGVGRRENVVDGVEGKSGAKLSPTFCIRFLSISVSRGRVGIACGLSARFSVTLLPGNVIVMKRGEC
jgi:hypothetical protein